MRLVLPGLRRPAGPTVDGWDQLGWCVRAVVGGWALVWVVFGPIHWMYYQFFGHPQWLENHWPF